MKPEIINPGDKVLLDEIILFEKENNLKLPQEYIDFILENNGGDLEPNTFKYKGGVNLRYLLSPNEYIPIEELFDINDLEFPNQEFKIPDGWIGIGYVGSMSLVCISLNTEDYGCIYVTNYILTDTPKEPMSWHLLIANSFTEFINGFEEDPDD